MCDEHRRGSHEVPWLNTDVKKQLQLVDSPAGLHRGTGVTLDRQPIVDMFQDRDVFDHHGRLDKESGGEARGAVAEARAMEVEAAATISVVVQACWLP